MHNSQTQPQNWLKIWKHACLSTSTDLCHKNNMLGFQNGPLMEKESEQTNHTFGIVSNQALLPAQSLDNTWRLEGGTVCDQWPHP